jgi:hypothetical protein
VVFWILMVVTNVLEDRISLKLKMKAILYAETSVTTCKAT